MVDDRVSFVEELAVKPKFFTIQASIRSEAGVEHTSVTLVTKRCGNGGGMPLPDVTMVVITMDGHLNDELTHGYYCRVVGDFQGGHLAVHCGFVATRRIVDDHLAKALAGAIFDGVCHWLSKCVAEAKNKESHQELCKELHFANPFRKNGGVIRLSQSSINRRFCQVKYKRNQQV